MPACKLHSALPRRSLLSRLLACNGGIAAVEFAYLAPVMLLMFMGAFEVSRAISADRRFAMITAMTGDLIAREEFMDEAKLEGVMQAIDHVMKPYDTSSLKIGVISVQAENNKKKVKWSYSHNGESVPAKCADYTLPDGLIADRGSVIVVTSSYEYDPALMNYKQIRDLFSGKMNWTDKSTHTPRRVSCVGDANDQTCSELCS
jgi:Flp pilus assembly protein TadG